MRIGDWSSDVCSSDLSFADLPASDRWALAFYSGRCAFRDTTQGERIWQSDAGVRRLVPDMPTLTAMTPAALGAKIGQPEADAVMAYLRANPQAVKIVRAHV